MSCSRLLQESRGTRRALLGHVPLAYMSFEAALASHVAITRLDPPDRSLSTAFLWAMLIPLLLSVLGVMRRRNPCTWGALCIVLLAFMCWAAFGAMSYPRPATAESLGAVAAAWWCVAFMAMLAHAWTRGGRAGLLFFGMTALWAAATTVVAGALFGGIWEAGWQPLAFGAQGSWVGLARLARSVCAFYAAWGMMGFASAVLPPSWPRRPISALLALVFLLLWQLYLWPIGEAAGLWRWHAFLNLRWAGTPPWVVIGWAISVLSWLILSGVSSPAMPISPPEARHLFPEVGIIARRTPAVAATALLVCALACAAVGSRARAEGLATLRARLVHLGWLAPDEIWRPGEELQREGAQSIPRSGNERESETVFGAD